jgi:hypothetical protein
MKILESCVIITIRSNINNKNNLKRMEEKKYKTSDLYLTAFLRLKGYSYEIEKNRNKIFFVFQETDDLLVKVNNYLMGNSNCDALSYSNSIKNLKNFIYNNR